MMNDHKQDKALFDKVNVMTSALPRIQQAKSTTEILTQFIMMKITFVVLQQDATFIVFLE